MLFPKCWNTQSKLFNLYDEAGFKVLRTGAKVGDT